MLIAYVALTSVFAVATVATAPLLGMQSPLAQRSDTIVRQAGAPLHPGTARLVEEMTLGAGRSGPEYEFSRIGSITIDQRDGSILLIDRSGDGVFPASTVNRYDRNGVHVRSYGRPGQGPGEFRSPGAVVVHPDGRVLVSDTRAIHVYSSSGTTLADWTTIISGTNFGSQFFVTPAGTIHVQASVRRSNVAFSASSTVSQLFQPVTVRLRSDGAVIDTIAHVSEEFPRPNRMERVDVPFVPHYIYANSPLGYTVTTFTSRYAIDLRIPPASRPAPAEWRAGDPVVSIRRNAPAIPVQNAERADWRQSIEMFMRSGSRGGSTAWQWSGPQIPGSKPAISALMISDDGRIWARLHQPAQLDATVQIPTAPVTHPDSSVPGTERAARRWKESALYDLFEPTGQYLGQVRIPDDIRIGAIREDTVWGIVTDKDGVQSVKRYRLNWSG